MLVMLLAWIIVGGIAGLVASKITGTDAQVGLLGNIIAGVIGGVVGGFLLSLGTSAGSTPTFSIGSFLVSLLGAVVVLFAYRKLVLERR